jgi:hypothetical protein
MVGALLIVVLAAQPVAAVAPFSATDVRREISSDGASATVQSLWRAGRWVVVENGVASGDVDWVALAPIVAPGTDAGTSEGLSIALADALPKSPQAVLSVVTPGGGGPLDLARVCSAPFIEDTPAHHAAYLQATLEALARPMPIALRPAAKACLAQIRQAH